MNAAELLREVERHGARLRPNGDRLRVEFVEPLPDDLMDRLRQHKPELLRLLADPSAPCEHCGCGSYWHSGGAWHCEACAPPSGHVERWCNVSGGKVAPMPPPALPWPGELTDALKQVSTHFEWSRQDIADFCRWARRSPEAMADAAAFLHNEAAKLPQQPEPAGRRQSKE